MNFRTQKGRGIVLKNYLTCSLRTTRSYLHKIMIEDFNVREIGSIERKFVDVRED